MTQAAATLSHSYGLLAEAAQAWIWSLDPAAGGFKVHGDLSPLLGRNFDDLDDVLEATHPDDAAPVRAALAKAREEGGGSDLVVRLKGQDGKWIHFHVTMRAEPTAEGCRLHGVCHNITPLIEARQALEHAERLATMAAGLAGVGYWRVDLRTGEYTWSPELYRLYGLDPAGGPPSIDATANEYCHADDRERLKLHRRTNADEPAAQIEVRIVRPDGEIRNAIVRSSPERSEAGEIIARFGTMIDVSEIRRAEAAASESEQRYRFLAEKAPDMIARLSVGGEIRYVSPSSVRVFGYTPEEQVRQNPVEMVHPDDLALVGQAINRLVSERLPRLPEPLCYRARHKDGHWIWVESNPELIFDEHGSPIETIDILRDVTRSKMVEAELEEARARAEAAAAAKAAFLANMSHELRTPLTSIIGFSRLLGEREDLTDDARRYAKRISDASDALLAIINDVLDFSKLDAGQVTLEMQPLSVCRLVEEATGLFAIQASAKGVRILAELDKRTPALIAGDVARLRQVLLNFLSNAVKFTDQGSVTVKTCWKSRGGRGRLRLVVRDTGQGIDPEKAAQLFQRFSQGDVSVNRTHGGTGLGLAISKGVIELMGGRIGVDSRPGEGSAFWFEIPAEPAQAQETSDAEAVAGDAPLSLRILMVDDTEVNRELVKLMLAPVGLQIEEASSGAEGVRAALERPFDLILMDVRMPGVDGLEATRVIRGSGSLNSSTPIIALTADVQPENASSCRAAGMNDVLAKPIVPQQLLAKIVEWAASAGGEAADRHPRAKARG